MAGGGYTLMIEQAGSKDLARRAAETGFDLLVSGRHPANLRRSFPCVPS